MRQNRRIKVIASSCCVVAASCALCLAGTTDLRLIQAVKSNDLASVTRLIKERVDVNARYGDGSTALAWAAYDDNLPIADLLIRNGASVSAANEDGATPLHLACTNRSVTMVDRLIAAGGNVNARMMNGESVLMSCARSGEPKTVKTLLAHGADVNLKETAHNQTALMWAVAEKHPEVTRLLIEAKADVRARSSSYPTTVVGEQTQKAGREKLNYTVIRGGMTPLLFAARSGDVESAKLLLAAGADANDAQGDGMSALVLAAHSGSGAVAELLLDKDARPNADQVGYTALHAAVLRDDLSLVKALLAHGAKPDTLITKGTPIRRANTDYNLPNTLIGYTPYLLAAKFAEPDIMAALAAGGANPKFAAPNGTTALMLAAGMGSTRNRRVVPLVESDADIFEAVKESVTLGADVNAASSTGDTALHFAATAGSDKVIQLLADHGADLKVKNKRGQTALALAASGGGRRAAAAAAADADVTGEKVVVAGHPSTVALLRKLGATE